MKKVLTAAAGVVLAWIAGCGPADPQQRVNAGAEALAGGDISRGVLLLERAAQELPRDGRAQNLYGQALHLFGKPAEAAKVFWQAIEANPSDPAPHYNLGLAAYVERDYPTAAEQIEASVALDPRNVPAWLFLGATYLHLNNLDAAYRATATALEVAPRSLDALNNLAVISYRRGRSRDAEAWLMQILQLAPDYAPACLNLARLYETEIQDKARALEFYRRYARMAPESPYRFAVTGATRRLELDLNLASPTVPGAPAAAAATHAVATAKPAPAPPATAPPAAATAATAPMPPDLQAAALRIQIDQLAGAHRNREASELALRLAEVYRQQNDVNRIGDAYTRAVELDPLNALAHFRLGEYLRQQGQGTAALQSYQEAARLQPQMTDAVRRIAALAEESGQVDVAVAAHRRVIELAPEDRPAYLRLAEIQERQLKQRAKAEQTYHAFLKKFPNAPEATQVRARLGLRTAATGAAVKPEAKKPAATKPSVEKPMATPAASASAPAAPPPPPPKPLDVAATYKDALNLLLQGDYDRARPELEAVVQAAPSHAKAHLALAQVYSMRAETKDRARAHYVRFLQLQPNDPKAPEVRRWLEATR
ncbi:MAG: tetratricopeptide repeat protein [Verrucomicrobia bacterium]|nr:tetratricopeptide repeat protein [Verrucomicrobiota bacterium]